MTCKALGLSQVTASWTRQLGFFLMLSNPVRPTRCLAKRNCRPRLRIQKRNYAQLGFPFLALSANGTGQHVPTVVHTHTYEYSRRHTHTHTHTRTHTHTTTILHLHTCRREGLRRCTYRFSRTEALKSRESARERSKTHRGQGSRERVTAANLEAAGRCQTSPSSQRSKPSSSQAAHDVPELKQLLVT